MTQVKLTRRGFIQSAVVTAAGVSFAVCLASCGQRKVDEEEEPGVDLLSWIVIHPDNTVTLRVPQTELGQGVSTTLPQMLAEELELDWKDVKAEFYDPALNKRFKNVYVWTTTLSSSSAHLLFEPTQRVGAQIREMLRRAASAQLGVPLSELRAEKGHVAHQASGKRLSYASLAEAAVKLTPPDAQALILKVPASRNFIGKPVPRFDLEKVTTGLNEYGIDVHLPGMRFAAIRQCPTFGGKLRNFKREALKGLSGNPAAVHVLAARVGFNSPVPEGQDPDLWAAPVVMDDAVAIVADSWWQAKSALDQIPIEWDSGEHAEFSSEGLRKTLSDEIRGGLPVIAETGDAEAALSVAAKRASAEYFYPYMDPAPLEPMNCTAYFDGGEVHVWTNSQYPDDAWRIAYELAGVSPDRAHLHLVRAGGGFGRRCQNDFVHQAVQIAKDQKGTPIKLIWTREESIKRSYYAPMTVAAFNGGIDDEGRLSAWACAVASGMAAEQSYGALRFPFQPTNTRFEYRRKRDTVIPFGWMRGVGFAQHLWMNFSFLDELRLLSGHDPVGFYRALLNPKRIPADQENRDDAIERARKNLKLLDFAIERGFWNDPKPRGIGRGIVVSDSNYYPGYTSSTKAAIVDVSLDEDRNVKVERVFLAIDAGTVINPDIVHAQLEGGVAYALTTALHSEITLENGQVQQSNFHDYPIVKMDEMPVVTIEIIPSNEPPLSIGEDAVPITIAALVNALADAGAPRIRRLPVKSALQAPA